MTLFDQFVTDAEAGAQYAKWAHDNPGELARWVSYRDAIVAGGRPSAPVMLTPHGRELVDGGLLYLAASRRSGLQVCANSLTPRYTHGH